MNCTLIIAIFAVFAAIASAQPPHPALLPPDGKSHRGDKRVGDTLTKAEDILALGKLYQSAREFETRQEYFLRLLDYFWFSERRLVGMKRTEIERVLGAGHPAPVSQEKKPKETRFAWSGGRDSLLVWFENDVATGAFYVMGY